jgi:hypothetical protein
MESSFGKVLGTTADAISEWSPASHGPRVLWVHFRGFLGPWDAPPKLAERLIDEEDPEIAPSLEVPQQTFDNLEDAEDDVFLASCRYAGQVMALDECLGVFELVLSRLWPGEPPSTVVVGTRGFALGEHGEIGQSDLPYGEQFHVPLLIRSPETGRALQRESALTQPAHLSAMLAALADGGTIAPAAAAFASGATRTGSSFLQNDEWHFVQPAVGERTEAKCELYVKPDDLWEANDVASRCPEVVDEWAQTVAVLGDRSGEERRT